MSASNMSWRRLTCRDDSSCGRTGVARAGKAVEQSAERSVSRPSTLLGDDERVVDGPITLIPLLI